jgi:hypothetical protein
MGFGYSVIPRMCVNAPYVLYPPVRPAVCSLLNTCQVALLQATYLRGFVVTVCSGQTGLGMTKAVLAVKPQGPYQVQVLCQVLMLP